MIQKIISVSNGGKEVNRVEAHVDEVLYQKLTVTGGRSMPIDDGFNLLKEVLISVEAEENAVNQREFCILFILEAFGYYLGTKSSKALERKYLKFFKGRMSLEDLKNMRWCDLIADCLIDYIIAFKKGEVKMCFGAVAILEVTDVLSSECL
jgi:hypothetical protein